MSDYLPQELWVDIFTRLSVKTLVRSRSVCKFFHSIITSPNFISEHINRAKNNQIPLVRYLKGRDLSKKKEHYLLLLNDLKYKQEIDFPFKSKCYKHFQIVGSCNGLFCLSDGYNPLEGCTSNYGIILWNPSIRKYLSLPKPQVTTSSCRPYYLRGVFGFGYDCQTDDYKVVRIMYASGSFKVKWEGDYPSPPHPQGEIYTVKSRAWRFVNYPPIPYEIWGLSQAFVEGSVHWPATGHNLSNMGRKFIVSFDMSNEVFRVVNLTEYLESSKMRIHVKVLREKLAVVEENIWGMGIYAVWVMEQYGMVESCRKIYTVDQMKEYLSFVGFTHNGDIIGARGCNKLIFYHPHSITNVGVRGNKNSFHVESYMESLVLLDGRSAILQSEATPISCEDETW